MSERVADLDAAKHAFLTLADAEGAQMPTYARICRIVADDPELHGLLLLAPTGQRLPVLVLAAIHDVVLRHPELPLAAWYPSVTGGEPPEADPDDALHAAVRAHRDEIVGSIRTRQVQTNEVNRCCAWWWGLAELAADDPRPISLVELGASAGLNLLLDRYAYGFDIPTGAGADSTIEVGDRTSAVRLGTIVRWPDGARGDLAALSRPLPEIVARVGLDRRPVDPTDPDEARWLRACTWPEQRVRFHRMTAAIRAAAAHPPEVRRGDLVDDLAPLIEGLPEGTHVVVLSSWVLAYVERARREALGEVLAAAARSVDRAGGRLSMISLEARNVVPWIAAPTVPEDAPASVRHASVLAATRFDDARPQARALARCQAHLSWCEPF